MKDKRFILNINENQAYVLRDALEEYCRIRMGQWDIISDSLAFKNFEYLHDADDESWNNGFRERLNKRDIVTKVLSVLDAVLKDELGKKSESQLVAEDIWRVVKHELWESQEHGQDDWSVDSAPPLHVSQEPMPICQWQWEDI